MVLIGNHRRKGMSKQAGNEPWAVWAESMQKMMSNPGGAESVCRHDGAAGMPGMLAQRGGAF